MRSKGEQFCFNKINGFQRNNDVLFDYLTKNTTGLQINNLFFKLN